MDHDEAERLASEWVAGHESRSEDLLASRSWMTKEIEETLSGDALAAAAMADGTPAVIALDGERVCWLTLDGSREGEIRTQFGSMALLGISLTVDGTLKARGTGISKSRAWRLQSPSASVTITTETIRAGAFRGEVRCSPGEQVMQEIARRCGQPIPLVDAS